MWTKRKRMSHNQERNDLKTHTPPNKQQPTTLQAVLSLGLKGVIKQG